ncbi:MAG: OsmC family protein [Gemmatimonadota bacterium]
MTGTLGGALEARGIPSHPGKLSAEVEGDIEKVGDTIAITRIRVKYRIVIPRGEREAAERALKIHQERCPVALSLTRGVEISWEAEFEEE